MQYTIDLHGFGDVFEAPRSQGLITDVHFVLYLIMNGPGNADASPFHHRITSYNVCYTKLLRIGRFRGRVVAIHGDSLLAEFASVVAAVQCAVEIQNEIAARNEALPDASRMLFRIGINLGDVIEEEGNIYGDGVNVATRLQSLVEGGGICISRTVHSYNFV